jgi:hypothetical protein
MHLINSKMNVADIFTTILIPLPYRTPNEAHDLFQAQKSKGIKQLDEI